ncbi:MAG TPA: 3-deoxy-D-manno-octulosonic acid transferase [Steroidobacteraceae bacterium]
MRRLYTLVLWLALPWLSLQVLWRGLRERAYWQGWAERFGGGAAATARGGIWVHAVSVGEVQASAALIGAIRERWPTQPMLITSATPAGRARARELFGTGSDVRYAPYDLPPLLRRLLRARAPSLLIVMETEIWPNLLAACAAQAVPVLFASARISARTAGWYRRMPGLVRDAMQRCATVAAQSAADAERFATLGVPLTRLGISGNIKFEQPAAAAEIARGRALRKHYAAGAALWVAGSTHADEELALLDAYERLASQGSRTVLALAPRHAPRFAEVAALLGARGLRYVRHSQSLPPPAGLQVVLIDTLGELRDFYAAADLAFVGGSLVPIGGHNLLEPAAFGVAILAGPHQFNAPQISAARQSAGGLRIVNDKTELAAAAAVLLADPAARAQLGTAAGEVIAANRGALDTLMTRVGELYSPR